MQANIKNIYKNLTTNKITEAIVRRIKSSKRTTGTFQLLKQIFIIILVTSVIGFEQAYFILVAHVACVPGHFTVNMISVCQQQISRLTSVHEVCSNIIAENRLTIDQLSQHLLNHTIS
jgi:hypothetical protein